MFNPMELIVVAEEELIRNHSRAQAKGKLSQEEKPTNSQSKGWTMNWFRFRSQPTR